MYAKVSQSFRGRADEAAFFEAYVAAMLTRNGLYVLCHPWAIDGKDHGKTWDLDACSVGPKPVGGMSVADDGWPSTRLEIKSIKTDFTGPSNYPYPQVLVCSFNSWQRKWPGTDHTSRDFMFVSRTTGQMVWLPKGSPVTITEIVDRERPGAVQKTMQSDKRNLQTFEAFCGYCKTQ